MGDTTSDDTARSGSARGMNIDSALVRELAELLAETNLTEIQVEDGERKIKLSRATLAAPVAVQPHAAPPLPASPSGPATAPADHLPTPAADAIRSPMVGTAYLAAEPGADPFVSVGQQVKAGETLLIVEAMKVMNAITAPTAGTVREVLVGNGQPIEFDQPLIVVS